MQPTCKTALRNHGHRVARPNNIQLATEHHMSLPRLGHPLHLCGPQKQRTLPERKVPFLFHRYRTVTESARNALCVTKSQCGSARHALPKATHRVPLLPGKISSDSNKSRAHVTPSSYTRRYTHSVRESPQSTPAGNREGITATTQWYGPHQTPSK